MGRCQPIRARFTTAARPEMLRLTEKLEIDSDYFTQTLLIDFMRSHPGLTANWNIASDNHGHDRSRTPIMRSV